MKKFRVEVIRTVLHTIEIEAPDKDSAIKYANECTDHHRGISPFDTVNVLTHVIESCIDITPEEDIDEDKIILSNNQLSGIVKDLEGELK